MAQNVAGEGTASGQGGKLTVPDEGIHAYDGVVSPVLGVAEQPEVQARGEHGAVEMVCELLHAGHEAVHVHGERRRLDHAHFGMQFHGLHHAHHGAAAHDAVGVEHDHVLVLRAPAAAEVGHVAALALGVVAAATVENVVEHVFSLAEFVPGFLFGHPGVGTGGVAENEDVELVAFAGLHQGMPGGGNARHVFAGVFVVHGEENGGAGRVGNGHGVASARGGEAVHLVGEHPAARHAHPEADGNPSEQNGEKHGRHDFDGFNALLRQNAVHEVCAYDGGHEDQGHEQCAATAGHLFPFQLLTLSVGAVLPGGAGGHAGGTENTEETAQRFSEYAQPWRAVEFFRQHGASRHARGGHQMRSLVAGNEFTTLFRQNGVQAGKGLIIARMIGFAALQAFQSQFHAFSRREVQTAGIEKNAVSDSEIHILIGVHAKTF